MSEVTLLEGVGEENGAPAGLLKQESRAGEEAPSQIPRLVKQIPDDMWEAAEDEIDSFLSQELHTAEGERTQFMRKIARWQAAYRAPIPDAPKHFPIWNASNMVYPLIKEAVNTISAQIAQSTLTARPTWVLKDLAAEWKPFVAPLEEFLTIGAKRDMDLRKVATPWIISGCKLGSSILEIGNLIDVRRIYKYTPDGSDTYPSNIIRHDGPKAIHVPLQDFWIRFGETDIQDARWVARRMWLTGRQLRDAAAQGKFFGVDQLRGHPSRTTDEVDRAQEFIEKTTPSHRDLFEIFKVWLSWDIDGEGNMEELLLYYSKDARRFISKKFHPYWHGKRPYVKFGFFPVEHRFYDEGICEMLEGLQESISQMHNRRADNHTLANAAMIIKRKTSRGIMPGDPLYSAKVIETADIWNDIREFRLSEPYQSTVQEEQIERQIADNLVGMSDAQRGSALPVSRTTAAAQLALLQEQAKRIDLSVQSSRDALDEVGLLTTSLYYQYGTNGKALEWMGERGRVVEAIFRLPRRVVEIGQAISVSTPTSLQNRQVKRENSIALFQLLTTLYQQIIPLAEQMAPDALPMVVQSMVSSAMSFMNDVLASFEVTDPEDILAGLAVLERVLPSPSDMGGGDEFTRQAESSDLINKLGVIENLMREAQEMRGDPRSLLGQGPRRREVPLFPSNAAVPPGPGRTPPPVGGPAIPLP